ncbi:unnamed protein product, partial [marine sediment metagenome]
MKNLIRIFNEKHALTGLNVFFREIFTNPSSVGAVLPSSKSLANHIASQVPNHSDGIVLELGAGTGVVTQALLDQGVPEERIVVVEISNSLAKFLRRRFPKVNIVQGDASNLIQLLSD